MPTAGGDDNLSYFSFSTFPIVCFVLLIAIIYTITTSPLQKEEEEATARTTMYPALFLCHGGGPLPLLGEPNSKPLVEQWIANTQDIVSRHGPPRVIAVVSAHYNTKLPEVGGAAKPAMLYDYYNFPEESYHYQYPAPGSPDVAQRMVEAMTGAGLKASLSLKRPYDHGVFVPLLKMFPNADIPVVPISVLESDDPAEHIAMGQALRPFRAEGVFFVGSGSSMHHFKHFRTLGAGTTFNDELAKALRATGDENMNNKEVRLKQMRQVERMAGFAEAQPDGAWEHLMPLLVLVGTADGNAAREVANVNIPSNNRHFVFDD